MNDKGESELSSCCSEIVWHPPNEGQLEVIPCLYSSASAAKSFPKKLTCVNVCAPQPTELIQMSVIKAAYLL